MTVLIQVYESERLLFVHRERQARIGSFFCVQQNVNLIFELSSLSFAISVPVQDDTSKFRHFCTDTKEAFSQ